MQVQNQYPDNDTNNLSLYSPDDRCFYNYNKSESGLHAPGTSSEVFPKDYNLRPTHLQWHFPLPFPTTKLIIWHLHGESFH